MRPDNSGIPASRKRRSSNKIDEKKAKSPRTTVLTENEMHSEPDLLDYDEEGAMFSEDEDFADRGDRDQFTYVDQQNKIKVTVSQASAEAAEQSENSDEDMKIETYRRKRKDSGKEDHYSHDNRGRKTTLNLERRFEKTKGAFGNSLRTS